MGKDWHDVYRTDGSTAIKTAGDAAWAKDPPERIRTDRAATTLTATRPPLNSAGDFRDGSRPGLPGLPREGPLLPRERKNLRTVNYFRSGPQTALSMCNKLGEQKAWNSLIHAGRSP